MQNTKRLLVTSNIFLAVIVGALISVIVNHLTPPNCTTEEQVINFYRTQHNLYKLRCNQSLRESASARALNLYTYEPQDGEVALTHEGYQAHISNFYGDQWTMVGENLARGFDDYQEVVTGWDQSPLHKDNLLHIRACEMGVGQYKDVWVLHLGCK